MEFGPRRVGLRARRLVPWCQGRGGLCGGGKGFLASRRPMMSEEEGEEGERPSADLSGWPAVHAVRIILRGPLEKRGTEDCIFCSWENHDDVFVLWARGIIGAAAVGELAGRSGSAWRMHLSRHCPGWEDVAAETRVIYGGEVDRTRERVLSMMERAKDPLDREHLLEVSILTMRAYVAGALQDTEADSTLMGGLERMLGRLNQLTKELDTYRRERLEEAARLEQMTEDEARRELEQFKSELREVLLEHPEVYKEVLDRHDAWRREQVGLEGEGEGA